MGAEAIYAPIIGDIWKAVYCALSLFCSRQVSGVGPRAFPLPEMGTTWRSWGCLLCFKR